MWDRRESGHRMSASSGTEQPVDGSVVIHVEAAPQGMLAYTLDPDGADRVWHEVLLAHDDAVIGAATSPEQTAWLLVQGAITCIRREMPSLDVGGVTMRPETGPHGTVRIVAAGGARFLLSEWAAVARGSDRS